MKPINLKRNIKDIYLELSRFISRNYPFFITQKSPDSLGEYIPVICFHSVTHNDLKEKLIYLKENGYISLTAGEFLSILQGRNPSPPRPVLLTFDDGHISLWSVAYPLLKEFNFRAAAFIIPSYIENSNQPGQEAEGKNKEFKPIPFSMISWQQAREIQQSGIIEMQSHTLYHQCHFIGPRIVDFFSPLERHTSQWLEMPVWRWKGRDVTGYTPPFGLPLYKLAARMTGIPRYFEDEELSYKCAEFVQENGGGKFFEQRNWSRKLAAVAEAYEKKEGRKGCFEGSEETINAIRNDILRSKELIEEHIPGHQVSFLSFPWGIGSQLAVEQSRKLEFNGTFWIIGPEKRANYKGGNPFFINRIKDDYIFRLPGKNRKSLWEIFKIKLHRRMKGQDIY